MRRRIGWATYFQGAAVVIAILVTLQYVYHPLFSEEPSPGPVKATEPPTPPPPARQREAEEREGAEAPKAKGEPNWEAGNQLVMPRLLSARHELVAWINTVATFQEVEALNILRKSLTVGRDALSITRQLQHLRPDGWRFCVQEGELCHCDGLVRYGDFSKDEWVERKEIKNPVLCHFGQFGLTPEQDLSPGHVKYCQCQPKAKHCPANQPYRAENCPEGVETPCRAGCATRMSRAHWQLVGSSRGKLCERFEPNDLLWSCDARRTLKPQKGHKHAEAEELLERATTKLCEDGLLLPEMEVWLECDFLSQFLQWTTPASPWLEEAFVTYVGGKKDGSYEWQATNLIRSIDLFSSRPLVVVIFGSEFVPPLSWQNLRHVICFRMRHISRGVSFNFNKIRSILAARVLTGIQLDTDQVIFKGMDQVFAGTKRESHAQYPWPILPVHWMSRDETPGNPYAHYAFKGWDGPQSMRWNHAHPTWTTFWALIWFGDLMHERMLAATGRRTSSNVFDLEKVKEGEDLLELVRKGEKAKVKRHVEMSNAMWEDEDMMNVNLWRHKVSKAWCKFDLEPNLFLLRKSLDRNIYFDPKWYPEGVPVLFLSIHNTKNFDPSDLLLKLLELCQNGVEDGLECPKEMEFMLPICRAGVEQERNLRLKIEDYPTQACCCLEPRWSHPAYWHGKWYRDLKEVPEKSNGKQRRCLVP
ncbi:unnamed protein product [Effrenium voratum]|nr:unnamed protein product [Effrenium voratum]